MSPADPGTAAPRAFGAMLQGLREDGCTILVANDRDSQITKATARVVLGSPEERRYRVLAFEETPDVNHVAGFLPPGVAVEDETVSVVSNGRTARSAAKPVGGSSLGPDGTGLTPSPDLEPFAHEVNRTLAGVGERFGAFRPAALRVATFDLSGLADWYGVSDVRLFCRLVGAQVRGLGGMAYFFLGDSMDDRLVGHVEHLFDARVDVTRVGDDGEGPDLDPGEVQHEFEQRWHVSEFEYTSPWFPMEPPE